MGSRVLWRRAATAAGMYSSVVLGLLGTLVASRALGPREFGLLTVVLSAVGFAQSLLDLTVEEALVKYGFRYVEGGDWGRLRRLFGGALVVKTLGALLALGVLAALAPFGRSIFGEGGLLVPFLIAALLPLPQAIDTVAGVPLILRQRYDLRAGFLALTQALRFAGLAIGCQFGVSAALAAVVLAQVASSSAVAAAGFSAFRRFPRAPARPLGSDRRELVGFIARSSVATAVLSLRGSLAAPLLGAVSSPTQAGYFKIAQAPQQGLASATSPARLILLTEQTRDWERGAPEVVFASVRRFSAGAALLMGVAVPVFYVLMPPIFHLLWGHRYDPGIGAARLILIAGAIQFVIAWTKSLPFSIGRPGLRILTHGIEALVFVPLVVVLGLRWHVVGAAWAVLISTIVFAAVWVVLLGRVRRETAARHEIAPAA